MNQKLFEKLSNEEKLTWNNSLLQVENLQMKLFIAQHNQEEFLVKMKEKYKEKENGNDR